MTGLLVSVRNAIEARLAFAGGASVIDVKEPIHGSLGRASDVVLADVAAAIGDRVPLSAALGELANFPASLDSSATKALQLPSDFRFAKIGLAGVANDHNWRERWQAVCDHLPPSARPVAVVYADWQSCGSPAPEEVLTIAQQIGCSALLIDTFDKFGGNLFAHLAPVVLKDFAAAVAEAGLPLVLAGSLDFADFGPALEFSPELLAVRGAVCRGGRAGPLDVHFVAAAVAETSRVGSA